VKRKKKKINYLKKEGNHTEGIFYKRRDHTGNSEVLNSEGGREIFHAGREGPFGERRRILHFKIPPLGT